MHYHVELIIPKIKDLSLNEQIERIMKQVINKTTFSYYIIGGRFAGRKKIDELDDNKMDNFYNKLQEKEITVSGIVAGKETLKPKEQIEKVDNLWFKYFPDWQGEHCPVFDHANKKYEDDPIYGDIMELGNVAVNQVECNTVIFAHYDAHDYNEWNIERMYRTKVYNGFTHQETKFDGQLGEAMIKYEKHLEQLNDDFAEKINLEKDWLTITLDLKS